MFVCLASNVPTFVYTGWIEDIFLVNQKIWMGRVGYPNETNRKPILTGLVGLSFFSFFFFLFVFEISKSGDMKLKEK